MVLSNEDTDDTIVSEEVSNGFLDLDDSGTIGPGLYRLTVEAYAEVIGDGLVFDLPNVLTDLDVQGPPTQGYETSAGYRAINLSDEEARALEAVSLRYNAPIRTESHTRLASEARPRTTRARLSQRNQ